MEFPDVELRAELFLGQGPGGLRVNALRAAGENDTYEPSPRMRRAMTEASREPESSTAMIYAVRSYEGLAAR